VVFIKPFKALRPAAEHAKQVACVPYDVVYESEVRAFIANNPLSFLRVTRPEADFPPEFDPTPEQIFAHGRKNLESFIAGGVLATDPDDDLYVYQLASEHHTQTGVVGCCSIDEYEQGLIKKHENVRPDKVEERTAHLLAVASSFWHFAALTRSAGLSQVWLRPSRSIALSARKAPRRACGA
jgi:uncharacterized protein (DUF1015 family)